VADPIQTIRAFLAVPLPESHLAALDRYLDSCRALHPNYRWVPTANLHLTLRFFGHLSPSLLDQVRGSLVGLSFPRFQLQLEGLGYFGPAASPRVVWIGAGEGGKEIARLAEAIDQVCDSLGLSRDRPFSSHLTLARAGRTGRRLLLPLRPPPELPAWEVGEAVLFQSRPAGPRPPSYLPLARFRLL
jgi:RNA 2',3'-cyclic 3'-phosphodiesterase